MKVYDQAAELGSLLHLPVIYASPPSPALYVMGPRELAAVHTPSDGSGMKITGSRTYHAADWMVEEDDEDEEEEVEVEIEMNSVDISASVAAAKVKPLMGKVIDFTEMASHVWIDGIRDPSNGRYLPGRTPLLFITKRGQVGEHGKEEDSLTMGGRPLGALERMQERGVVSLQPPITRTLVEKKQSLEDIVAVHFASPTAIPAPLPATVICSVQQPDSSKDVVHDVDDDDDFFGIASTLDEYKRRPAKPVLISVEQAAPLVAAESLMASTAAIAAVASTTEEITDKRKSKKQMLVSVQARLAERQRLILEAQQKRQGVTRAATSEKEVQKKEYQLRKASLPLASSVTLAGVSARGSAATPLVEKENRELITESLSVLHKVVAAVEEDFPAVEDDDDSDGLWA